LRYLLQRRGPLTVSAGYAAAFIRTRPESTRPDGQVYFINFSTAKRGGVLHPHSGFTLSLSQLQAESRGSVRTRDVDPAAPPAIRYNYLSTENERRTMVGGLKFVRRLAAARPLADYVAGEFQPGPRVQSDADWLEYCRETGETVFHPTSTCRMGEDARAVVDPALRVRGLAGLRVIDASILPSVVSGNTNAAVFALAEKGAELVRADANRP
jgi:choline dehydrogenase